MGIVGLEVGVDVTAGLDYMRGFGLEFFTVCVGTVYVLIRI